MIAWPLDHILLVIKGATVVMGKHSLHKCTSAHERFINTIHTNCQSLRQSSMYPIYQKGTHPVHELAIVLKQCQLDFKVLMTFPNTFVCVGKRDAMSNMCNV